MKKLLFLLAIFTFGVAFSQVSMSGNKLLKDGQTYKLSEYKQVFKNQEAANYFSKARTNNTVGQVFAFTGGLAIGISIPMLLTKKENGIIMNTPSGPVYGQIKGPHGWGYTLIGAGLIGVGIPFALAAKKNADKAISVENGGTTAFQPYFKLESTGTGVALSYNF